jgi:predicted protein tyrosine phosphatase
MSIKLRRVIFIGQQRAEAMQAPRHSALISITDPNRPPAKLQDGWAAVLRTSFDDIDPVTFPDDFEDLRAIGADQVIEIAEFVRNHARTCRRMVVHCRYGVSRSAAVAKAIAEAADISFPVSYDEHNRFVYLVLGRVLRHSLEEASRS